jgi:16S rRNA (uracil1498-N3)-methyltransferase
MENIKKAKTRVYIKEQITQNSCLDIKADQAHHISVVLRIGTGDYISIFNETHGEFLGKVIKASKNNVEVEIVEKLKDFIPEKNITNLFFAPLKKDATDFVIEKATELGITSITQVLTQYTVNKPIETNKLEQKLTQATQQCGRLDVPMINSPCKLTIILEKTKHILWLNEKRLGVTLSEYVLKNNELNVFNILIGPEGGFSKEEFEILSTHKNVIPVYLNTNTLRAETACLASIINIKISKNSF